MVINIKNILGIVPGLQSTALVAENIPKKFSMKKDQKTGMKSKGLIKRGIKTIVGIGLIKPTAGMINKLP